MMKRNWVVLEVVVHALEFYKTVQSL